MDLVFLHPPLGLLFLIVHFVSLEALWLFVKLNEF